MNGATWLALFAAAWAISISPGAGAVAAMNAGLLHGFRRGYVMTLGLILGIMTQLLLVALGLGAVVATSNTAFELVKWFGAGYLVWLGVQQWRTPLTAVPQQVVATPSPTSARSLIAKGWLINVSNPKGTVFLLAVVPQFVDPGRPLSAQYAIIGATLAFTDLVVMAAYTALAARVLAALKSPRHVKCLNRAFGVLFVLAGLSLSLFKRSGGA